MQGRLPVRGGLEGFRPGLSRTILKKPRFLGFLKLKNLKSYVFMFFMFLLFSSQIFYFFVSNSVNFYEFIGFITFNIEVHELVYMYSFLVDRILVSNVPRAIVRRH